jgi:uroporphyrinogen-III synthase
LNNKLKNKTVLITKAKSESAQEVEVFQNAGAAVISFPTIKIIQNILDEEKLSRLSKWNSYDFLIFTSVNAVRYFRKFIKSDKTKNGVKIICTGSKTKEASERQNIEVDLVPDEFSAKGILNLLADFNVQNKKILIPSSAIARTELRDGLKELGTFVDFIPVYNVVMPAVEEYSELLEKCKANEPDILLFTSPSSFNNYLKIFKVTDKENYFKNKLIAAIGNTTAAAIEAQDLKVDILPSNFTLMDTVNEIMKFKYETILKRKSLQT